LVTGLPVRGNADDDYTVIAWAPRYAQAGFFPVRVSIGPARQVDLMLIPEKSRFDFSRASWERLKRDRPVLWQVLRAEAPDEEAAQRRYERLMQEKPASLACLLNIAHALSQIKLPDGKDPLSYVGELIWDNSMAQDRFFGYADVDLLRQIRAAARQGVFGKEAGPGIFHPGAFTSFKQLQFDQANVQLTFHHDDQHEHTDDWHHHKLGRVRHVKIEPDIDYYKDLMAHFLLEVIPNKATGGLTDPRVVYQLRWMAGQEAGAPEFDPGYDLVP
jgi:hypothetical protein